MCDRLKKKAYVITKVTHTHSDTHTWTHTHTDTWMQTHTHTQTWTHRQTHMQEYLFHDAPSTLCHNYHLEEAKLKNIRFSTLISPNLYPSMYFFSFFWAPYWKYSRKLSRFWRVPHVRVCYHYLSQHVTSHF